MICVRTAGGSSRGSLPKKMSIHCLPSSDAYSTIGALGMNNGNFYYGNGQLGLTAPYAESIAPSHHSTYAHYYDEDEDGWEMPNFYNETYMKESLNKTAPANGNLTVSQNGGGGGIVNPAMNLSQAVSNPSLYGNKEELYDRLRRHQYQGKKDVASDSEDQQQ